MESSSELPSDGPYGAEFGRLQDSSEFGCSASVERQTGDSCKAQDPCRESNPQLPQKALAAYGAFDTADERFDCRSTCGLANSTSARKGGRSISNARQVWVQKYETLAFRD